MLEEKIKAEAARLGFSLAGITSPAAPEHLEFYENWLAEGRQAEMSYLAGERALTCRRDMSQLLPDVQAVIVLGLEYPAALEQGPIAAYALQEDYHLAVPVRLQALIKWLQVEISQPLSARVCTDSAPVLERSLAQRAGLGWAGKNSCLISPRHGSFFLLAEVLVNLPLQPDEPFTADRCGSCQRCMQACPTGCIQADRSIDSRGCISYLTIENKGAIPVELRPKLAGRVFGCDICQQVCPWNESALRVDAAPTQPDDITLLSHLSLTPQEFNRLFYSSPILRAKRRGYLRNLCVYFGNQRNREALPALKQVLKNEPEPLVRAHAAWALGCFERGKAEDALKQALADERDESVRVEIMAALSD